MFYTGAVIAGFGFLGNTWLLKRYFPSRVTVISLSQPVLAVLLSWWLLGEEIGPELWVAVACVVVGSFLVQRRERKETVKV
jgi:drug/metabolite transporter (DMT)-like permease